MSTKAEVLRSVPLFQGMTDRSIETIASLAEETRFESGSTLVREGEPGDQFLIIRDGSAVVDQGGHAIRELGSGDFLGEISLIDGRPRSATVTATAPQRVESFITTCEWAYAENPRPPYSFGMIIPRKPLSLMYCHTCGGRSL